VIWNKACIEETILTSSVIYDNGIGMMKDYDGIKTKLKW